MSENCRLGRKIGFQNTFYTKCINVIIDNIGPSIILRSIPVNKSLRNLGQIPFISKSSSIYTKICLRHKHKTFWRSWRKFFSTTFIANTFC